MSEEIETSYRPRVMWALENPHRLVEYAGVIFLLAIPILLPTSSVQTWSVYLIYCMVAVSVDLVWGYTGLLTLGHAAYFGAGAYLTAKISELIPVIPEIASVFIFAPLFGALLTLCNLDGFYLVLISKVRTSQSLH